MRDLIRPRNNKGFTLIEGILAVVLLAFIGIGMAQFLLNATRSSTQVRRVTKASSLSDMVFEQYTAAASFNFHTIADFNVTNQTPKEFFKTADNMNYDGMTITTLATYSTDRTKCDVVVTLNWTEGNTAKSLTRSKVYVPLSTRPSGADVRVVVTRNGVGIPGIVAAAPSVYGGTITATTDSTGSALLRTVLPGPEIAVKAISFPSDYDSAIGVLGYYRLSSGTTNYTTSITSTTNIEIGNLKIIPFTEFQPMGLITGQLTNVDDPAEIDGHAIRLSSTSPMYVYKSGIFRRCGNTTASECSVLTNAQGTYGFYNVIPGTGTLLLKGTVGSAPHIQQTAQGFAWGYINLTPYVIDSDDWDWTARPTVRMDVSIRRKGWVVITPLFEGGVVGGSGTAVSFNVPETPGITTNDYTYTGTTGITGVATLYNVIYKNNWTWPAYKVTADRLPPPGDGYYAERYWWSGANSVGTANPININMETGYQLVAQLEDAAGAPPENIHNMHVRGYPWRGFTPSDYTDASGNLVLTGFTPLAGTNYSGNPAVPFSYQFFMSKGAIRINAIVNGRAVDYHTNQPIPFAYLIKNGTTVFQADAFGNFTATDFIYNRSYTSYNIYCVPATKLCYPAMSATNPTTRTMLVDTTQTKALIDDGPGDGWVINDYYGGIVQNGQTVNNAVVSLRLASYEVQGTVRNGTTGAPIQGIKIKDASTDDVEATSAANGTYRGWFRVSSRSSTNTGRVTLDIAPQTVNGVNYPALGATVIAIPTTPSQTPLTHDIVYQNFGGSGM